MPADGSTIASASSIAVTASEALSAVTGATLDGAATGAPTISGATATFATGPLADGPHTLAGTLVDLAGKTAPFTTHFTIVSGPPPADWPYVEMNAFPGVTTTLTSTDGGATVTMHPTTWSSTDHLVLRIDPNPPAAIGGGFATSTLVYDVTCYWSLTGVQVHSFSPPLEIVLANPTGDPTFVPATFENGAWRPIPLVPTPGSLPLGWSDGYFAGPGGIHILTTHLSLFTLLHDRFPPPPPRDVKGDVAEDGLTLRWAPGIDPTGPIAQVQLYVDGTWMRNFDVTQYETKMGPIAAGDSRTFTFTETDLAGNLSVSTVGLRALPPLAGRSVADATQALAAAGFAVGTVTREQSAAPANTVIAPAGVEVLPLGSAVALTVSAGPRKPRDAVQASRPRTDALPADPAPHDPHVGRGDRTGHCDDRAPRLPRTPARLVAQAAARRPEPPTAAPPYRGPQGADPPARLVLALLVGNRDVERQPSERPKAPARGSPADAPRHTAIADRPALHGRRRGLLSWAHEGPPAPS